MVHCNTLLTSVRGWRLDRYNQDDTVDHIVWSFDTMDHNHFRVTSFSLQFAIYDTLVNDIF